MQADALPVTLEVSAYRHVDKPEWGSAVIVWELDGKRGYLFEDGKTRVFKEGYYQLLIPMLLSAERGGALVERARGTSAARDSGTVRTTSRPRITLDKQIDHLLLNYPGGFAGEAWRLARREGNHVLKRHRDPVLARAAMVLSPIGLREGLDQPNCRDGWEALRALLTKTDLVSASDIKLVGHGGGPRERIALERLRDLLWETTSPESPDRPEAFDPWVDALSQVLRQAPSWPLATTPRALVHPGDHIVIRPSVLETQAACLQPVFALRLGKRPNGASYHRARNLVGRVRERLAERGVPPVDLFDVTDFIWATLRPAARAEIEARAEGERK